MSSRRHGGSSRNGHSSSSSSSSHSSGRRRAPDPSCELCDGHGQYRGTRTIREQVQCSQCRGQGWYVPRSGGRTLGRSSPVTISCCNDRRCRTCGGRGAFTAERCQPCGESGYRTTQRVVECMVDCDCGW